MPPRLMIQGCGSNVGKSILVAGLARAYVNRGLSVVPFKPQNMSNNAAVTDDGGEIGRAQALQALAARVPTSVHMNPVLLKPETERGAQVVVQGKRLRHATARDYTALKPTLLKAVCESFELVSRHADLVLVEGAGSPAEVNLRAGDIANMGFAEATDTPVIVVGDIDRGGVIAQVAGTKVVLDPADADRIKGFIINKFRGDVSLFDDGYRMIEQHTGWPGFGVVPWFGDAGRLPAEDASDLRAPIHHGPVKIVCLQFSRIANFDDLDPLRSEADCTIDMIAPGQAIPGDAALVILPGSKSTRGDLAYLRTQGWDVDLVAHHRRGGMILGVCGGYQMLGRTIDDPDGIEGPAGMSDGLGLLNVQTVMTPKKSLTKKTAFHPTSGTTLSGYEIHIGETTGADCIRPLFEVDGAPEGAVSDDGLVLGTYLHGMFGADAFRAAFLRRLGARSGSGSYAQSIETTLDALALHMEKHLDLDSMLSLAREAR